MKSLCLLLLVNCCPSQMDEQLSAPHLIVLARNSPDFGVAWYKVDSGDPYNPVIGYRVKVWELRKVNVTRMTTINASLVITLEEDDEEFNARSGPTGVPEEMFFTADETSVHLPHLKINVTYEIRVNAFTVDGDGLDSSLRVNLGPRKEDIANVDDVVSKDETARHYHHRFEEEFYPHL